MSMQKLSSAKKADEYYYEKDAIFGDSDETKNDNLQFKGELSKELGIFGTSADHETFHDLLNGKYKDIDLRYKDKVNSGTERVGYDFTFSAPKSVSHAGLVLGQVDVIEAHKRAVDSAMSELEKYAGARVKGSIGREIETTGKISYAQAHHSTARPPKNGGHPDPHLHTHNVIFNTTKSSNGDFRSLNTDEMIRQQNHVLKVYKESLAYNLKEAGYDLKFDSRGNFDIKGYDRETIESFSKRNQDIKIDAENMKNDERYEHIKDESAKRFAQHNFKKDKKLYTKDELVASWNDQHNNKNIQSKEELLKIIQSQKENKTERDKNKISIDEAFKIASENLMDKNSHVSLKTLKSEIMKITDCSISHEELDKRIKDIKNEGQINKLDLKRITVDGVDRFTNLETYESEKKIAMILSKSTKSGSLLSIKEAEKGIADFEKQKGFSLTKTQREATMFILTASEKYTSIQGDAGVGKTTMLGAIRHAYSLAKSEEIAKSDLGVLAPTGKASSGAEKESGIKAMTTDSYLLKDGFVSKSKSKNVFPDSKKGIQFFGGNYGVRITRDLDFVRVKKQVKSDPLFAKRETYIKEEVKTGLMKGAIKESKSIQKGDRYDKETLITFKDGNKIASKFSAVSPLMGLNFSKNISKNSETGFQTVNKNKNIFGLTITSRQTSYIDKEGKLKLFSAESKTSLFGITLKKTSYQSDYKEYQQNVSIRNQKGEYENFSSSGKSENLNKTAQKFDQQVKSASAEKVIFVDESSMQSSRKTLALLEKAERDGNKIVFIGDTKQIQSVQEGRSFQVIQEYTKQVHMNQSTRQKNAELKEVVDKFAKGEVSESIEKLEKKGGLIQSSKEESIKEIARDLTTKNDKGKYNYEITATMGLTRAEVSSINKEVRKILYNDENAGQKITVSKDKSLDLVAKTKAENYEVGDNVSVRSKKTGKLEEFSIESKEGNKISLVNKENKEKMVLDVKKDYKEIQSVSRDEELSIKKGEKLINLKNKEEVKNGEVGYVVSISKDKMKVDFDKKIVEFDLKKSHNLDYGYATTAHKAQGVTEDRAIALIDSKSGMLNKNIGYVVASRPRHELKIFTDDVEKFKSKIEVEQKKESNNDSKEFKDEMKEHTKKSETTDKTEVKLDKETSKNRDEKSDYKEFKSKIEDIDKKIEKVEKKIEYIKNIDEKGDKTKNISDSLNKEIESLKNKKDELIKDFSKKVNEIKSDKSEDKLDKKEIETKTNKEVSKNGDEKLDKREIEKSKKQIDKKIDSNEEKIQKLESKKDEIINKNISNEDKKMLSNLKEKEQIVDKQINTFSSQKERLESKLENKDEFKKEIELKIDNLKKEKEDIKVSKQEIEEKVMSKVDQKTFNEIKKIDQKIEETKSELDNLKSDKKEIEKSNEKLEIKSNEKSEVKLDKEVSKNADEKSDKKEIEKSNDKLEIKSNDKTEVKTDNKEVSKNRDEKIKSINEKIDYLKEVKDSKTENVIKNLEEEKSKLEGKSDKNELSTKDKTVDKQEVKNEEYKEVFKVENDKSNKTDKVEDYKDQFKHENKSDEKSDKREIEKSNEKLEMKSDVEKSDNNKTDLKNSNDRNNNNSSLEDDELKKQGIAKR